jgi:hypothetical protein
MLSSSGAPVGKVFMEIWMLPASEVMGTNIVGEERNDPNHSPNLPMPEDGRDLSDMFAGALGALGDAFGFLGGLYFNMLMKLVAVLVVFGSIYAIVKG